LPEITELCFDAPACAFTLCCAYFLLNSAGDMTTDIVHFKGLAPMWCSLKKALSRFASWRGVARVIVSIAALLTTSLAHGFVEIDAEAAHRLRGGEIIVAVTAVPEGGGRRTRLHYEAIIDPGVPVPGFIVLSAIEADARKTLSALRKEAAGSDAR
jgi:hypothetical protein